MTQHRRAGYSALPPGLIHAPTCAQIILRAGYERLCGGAGGFALSLPSQSWKSNLKPNDNCPGPQDDDTCYTAWRPHCLEVGKQLRIFRMQDEQADSLSR